MRLIVLGAIVAAVLSVAGLLAMTGTLRQLASSDLSAEVHLAEFPLPQGFGLEPQEVADFLVLELTERATDDIALRLALGSDGQRRLIEVAIPRLVNAVVVRDMIAEIKPLHNVLSVGGFRLSGQVVITNRGDARSDVALTLPGLLLAEGGEVETTSNGMTALHLDELAAGEVRVVKVWLGEPAVQAGAGLRRQLLLGDGAGSRGRVWLYAPGPWAGADLQAIPPARWAVAGMLAVTGLAAVLVLIIAGMTRLRLGTRRRRGRVSPA